MTTISDADLTAVVSLATRAPSVHNTQPWRWQARADGLDLYADRSRQLAVLDPTGRQLHLSCGAALLHARLAAASAGLSPETRLLPGGDPDHLAALDLRPGDREDEATRLVEAVEHRHTHRDPFSGRLADEVLERLRAAAVVERATLHLVTDPDDLTALTLLVARAEESERSEPAYREELARWVRPAGAQAHDGVPEDALPHPGPGTWVTSVQPRDFHAAPAPAPADEAPPAVEHPMVAVLVTERDDPHAWLSAGQALGRVLLELAAAGGAAQPLNQPLDMPGYREQVRNGLRLMGHPQMLLRLGSAQSTSVTGRRPVSDVLTP